VATNIAKALRFFEVQNGYSDFETEQEVFLTGEKDDKVTRIFKRIALKPGYLST